MDAYSLLKRDIREYIFDEGWEDLRPIQKSAIVRSVETDNNFILAAPTASGKTEAAFLPAINAVDEFKKGVKILYISPLKALINDQFRRISKLCSYLDVKVTSWHGEASQSEKRKLLKNPEGILLITPESIEAMLTLHPANAKVLLSGIEWIIIDEIHSFIGDNRGVHLSSLLRRMSEYYNNEPRYIGMSATLNREDYPYVKSFFKSKKHTDVLLDKAKNELTKTIFFSQENDKREANDAMIEIYKYSQKESMLVFPNSRGQVERISVNLKKINEKENGDIKYFAHHSSVSKEERLSTEIFAKEAKDELFTIVCTSTLELGIDIGSVDSVVQYNAPFSVASLSQRLGRSGRKTRKSNLHLVSTEPWQLLSSLSAVKLYEMGSIEPTGKLIKPFDVLAHQILAILMEKSGLNIDDLFNIHKRIDVFNEIDDEEMNLLISFLIENEYIEILDDEAIVGRKVEKLMIKGEFFALFDSEDDYSVYSSDKKIGEIPMSEAIITGENIFLGARIWKILEVDHTRKKIRVQKATDGRPPIFPGSPGIVSDDIRMEMKQFLSDRNDPLLNDINIDGREAINNLRERDNLNPGLNYIYEADNVGLRTFIGTRINLTLTMLLNVISKSMSYALMDSTSTIYGPNIRNDISMLVDNFPSDEEIHDFLDENFNRYCMHLNHMKYSDLLPKELKIRYMINNIFNIEGTLKYLEHNLMMMIIN